MKPFHLCLVVLAGLCATARAQEPGAAGAALPQEVQALLQDASKKAQNHDLAGAEKDCDQAVEKAPESPAPYLLRGGIRQERGNEKGAIDDYSKAISCAPKSPQLANAYYWRGSLYLRAEEYEKAIHDLSQVLTFNPSFAGAYALRGEAYAGLGDFKQALENAKGAIWCKPEWPGGYLTRARIEIKQGDTDAALADFAQALKRSPKDADALRDRALLYYGIGKYKEAAADYSKALAIDSSDPDYAQFFLYLSRGLSGDEPAAKQDLLKYAAQRKSKGKDDWALQVLDFLCGKNSQDDFLKAVDAAQDAQKKTERTCEATFYAAQVLLMQKKTDEATALLRKCLATDVRNFMEWQAAGQELKRFAPSHEEKSAPGETPPTPQK